MAGIDHLEGTEVEFRAVKVRELCVPSSLDLDLPLIGNIWTKKDFQGERHTLIALAYVPYVSLTFRAFAICC